MKQKNKNIKELEKKTNYNNYQKRDYSNLNEVIECAVETSNIKIDYLIYLKSISLIFSDQILGPM